MPVVLEVLEATATQEADLRERRVAEELEVQDALKPETPEEMSANTGGGGGAASNGPGSANGQPARPGGTGGSGIVVIRRVTACSPGASGGTTSTSGDDTIHTFTGPGTYTA